MARSYCFTAFEKPPCSPVPVTEGEPAMNHFLTSFLVPESSLPQATLTSPPANEMPVEGRPEQRKGKGIKFMVGIVADAAGFGLLLAGCWLSLQLMSVMIM